MTGESGHNHGSQETKNQVKDEGSHVVTDTGSIILVAENAAVHEVTDNTRQENNEGVGDTLNQCHGHHVTVSNVSDLMCQDSLHFFFVHAGKKTCGNSHHGRILCCAGCESIGFAFIDTDFRHRDTGFLRVMVNGVNEPSLEFGARMIDVNHLHAHRRFGNRLAHEQRDDGTAETDNPRKYQKCPIALAFPGNVREVDSENGRNNVENNSEYNQNGYVGQEE